MAFLWSLIISKIVTSIGNENHRTSKDDVPAPLNHNEPWDLPSSHSFHIDFFAVHRTKRMISDQQKSESTINSHVQTAPTGVKELSPG